MYFLDNNSGIATMPPLKETQSTTPLWFTEGDGHKGISWPGEDWFNIQQAEQLALLDAAGIRQDKGKLNQLTLAIRAIISQEALLKTQALAEIAAAGKTAQEKARTYLGLGKLATHDGIQEATLHHKGIVQLNSSPRSADETTAATPKAVNKRVNAVVDKAPSDLDTLNKLAHAISNNPKFAGNVMQLLSQKLAKNKNVADIPDKNQFVKNLGLLELTFPVGIVMWFAQHKNPNILFKGTTWKYIGENKTIRLGQQDGSDVLNTGGKDNLSLSVDNLPEHAHDFSARTDTFDYGHKGSNNAGGHSHQYNTVFRYNDVGDDGGGHALYGVRSENTSHSGDHSHITYIGPHSHGVSGTTKNTGRGVPVNIVNSFIKLMAWYRIS